MERNWLWWERMGHTKHELTDCLCCHVQWIVRQLDKQTRTGASRACDVPVGRRGLTFHGNLGVFPIPKWLQLVGNFSCTTKLPRGWWRNFIAAQIAPIGLWIFVDSGWLIHSGSPRWAFQGSRTLAEFLHVLYFSARMEMEQTPFVDDG